MNLIEGIQSQCQRVREILPRYEELGPEARVAIATLDSERAMNAQLTAELEAAEAALSALRARETGLREALHAIYKGLSSEKDGEFWTAQKWCDDHDIYVDNLQGLRVLEEVARKALSTPSVHGASEVER